MKRNNSKHELSKNNSQIQLTSSKSNITKENLNNLLLEVIETLDLMNNIISKIEFQQNNLQSHEPPQKNNLQSHETPQQNNLQSHETPQQSKHTHRTHSYIETNQNNNNEINVLCKLVKTIFQKLDDPNYKCENGCVEHKLAANITKNHQNTHNEKQKTSNESNQTVNKKHNLTQNMSKQKNINSRPLIKNLKFDPKCNEKQSESCTCSPIEKYYRDKGCSYINYEGRILAFNCSNDS